MRVGSIFNRNSRLISCICLILVLSLIFDLYTCFTGNALAQEETAPVEQVETRQIDHVSIYPETATVISGEPVSYSATAFSVKETEGWDITIDTVFSIDPEAGGFWDGNVYEAETAGTWTVTAAYEGFIAEAVLVVKESAPVVVESITISPENAEVTTRGSQEYTVTAVGLEGEVSDVTDDSAFTITPEAGGSWDGNVYEAEAAGTWTVSAAYEGFIADVVLIVEESAPAAVDSITISPENAEVTTGGSQEYTVTAVGPEGEVSDVTSDAVFEINPEAGGSWDGNVYEAEAAGTWTVTATYGDFTAEAILIVAEDPLVVIDRNGLVLDLRQVEYKEKGNPKLDSFLNELVSLETTEEFTGLALQNNVELLDEDKLRVIVECQPDEVEASIAELNDLGIQVETSYANLVQAVVPVSKINALSNVDTIDFVRLPVKPLAAEVTSEGVSLINADVWQTAGYTGAGVKVGILDGGFSGYSSRQGEGDLPASLTTWWAPSIGDEGDSVHGTACAEIIYDIAPGADYYLANFGTSVEMGNAVDWLIAQGVDVISCSVGWPAGGPGDGNGPICDIVDVAYDAGILWAQSAGNSAQRHWQGDFVDSDNFHEFDTGDISNAIIVSEGDIIAAGLNWGDDWGYSGNDYDLYLFDNDSTGPVAWSTNVQDGDDYPYESLAYTAEYTGVYHLVIYRYDSDETVNFHLYSYYHDLQYQVSSNSIIVPADSPNAIAVGAVSWDDPSSLEVFSSRGPTEDGRVKPDLVAPDGVSTASYGSSFYGTSASTPHVAGAAALVKERRPIYTPYQAQCLLESRAIDLGDTGKDVLFGRGHLYLGDATTDIWQIEPIFLNFNNGTQNSIAVDDAGNPHIFNKYSINDTLHYTYWDGFNWQTEAVVKHITGVSTLVLDSAGNPHVGYIKDQIAYYAHRDATGWHVESLSTEGFHHNICLALDSFDRPHIVYSSYDYLHYYYWDGSEWQYEYESVEDMGVGALILDSNDNPHVSYYDSYSGDLKHAWRDGSGWQTEAVDDVNDVGWYSSIVLNGSDYPCISYFNATNMDLKYAYWDGSDWHTEVVDSELIGHYWICDTDLALDSDGSPYIAYCTDAYQKTARWDGSGWQIEFVDILKEHEDTYCSLALDSSVIPNVAHLSYSQTISGSGVLHYARRPGIYYDTLVLTVAVNGGGSTTPTAGNYRYDEDAVVEITAEPDSGWKFVKWTGDVANPESTTTTVTMDSAKWVTAHFTSTALNEKIAFTSSRDGDYPEIYIMDPDGSNQTRLTDNAEDWVNDYDAALSPDCSRIAFVSSREYTRCIYTMYIDGSNVRRITEIPSWKNKPAWSPDGTMIAFQSPHAGEIRIYIMDGSGGNITQLTSDHGIKPAWSPDGDQIAFISNREGSGNIYIINTDGTGETKITNESTGSIGGVSWSSTDKLVYSVVDTDNEPQGLYIININGTGKEALPTTGALGNAVYPCWSPDGSKIAFSTTRHEPLEIYVVDSDGSNLVQLTDNDAADTKPSWAVNLSPQFTLTVIVSGGGSTTPAVGTYGYGENTIVDITAQPDPGWQFVNWTGDVAEPNSATTTVTMDADKTVTANFQPSAVPSLSGGQLTPETGYALTDFTYSVTYTDEDDDPPVSITVSIDGEKGQEMTVKDGEDGIYSNGETYEYVTSGLEKDVSHTYQFAATDGASAATGDTGEFTGPTVANSSPSVTGVIISPALAYTDDDLTAIPSGWFDADGDPEGYQWQWQKWVDSDWADIAGATGDTLTSDNFVRDEQIKVVCTPYDGTNTGTPREDTITIANTPPTAPVVDVTPDVPSTGDDLSCGIVTGSGDADGDTPSYSYAWYQNDVLQESLTGATVESINTVDGDTWRCVVTPYDGTDYGPTAEDEVIIGVPVLSGGEVTPETGYNNEYYTYAVVYTDGDNIPPASIQVIIDEDTASPVDMTETDAEDTDCTDGKDYQTTVYGKILDIGDHQFRFTASDGTHDAIGDTDIHDGPTVKKRGGGGGGGGGGDDTAPTISKVSHSDVTRHSVIISWKTQEVSTSRVEYWASPHEYSDLDETLVVNHEVKLTGLEPATTYYYQTISEDRAGNRAKSEECSFTTLGDPAEFVLSDLAVTPEEVAIGEEVSISVLVKNKGDAGGTYQTVLKVDGVEADTRKVTLEGGQSRKVTFTIIREEAGGCEVSIDDLNCCFEVIAPASTPEYQPNLAPPASATTDNTGGTNWTLVVGIIVAMLIINGLLIFYLIRRRT